MWNKWWIVLGIALLAVGCKTKKNITGQPKIDVAKPNAGEAFAINNLDFHTFTGRAKARVELGKDKQDVTMHIRIQRDQAIWISVTATVLNFEAARVLITPDSVKILNKMQSEYIAKPFVYIHRYTGPGISFANLQDLLMANVSRALIRTDQMTVASATDEVQLVGVKENVSFQYSLNANNRPKVFRLNLLGSDENLEAFYGNFNTVSGFSFPHNQNIKLNAHQIVVNALLDYNRVDFNQEVDMPFTVPQRYKRVD
ncbi:DUF4292 domain-containing protein [Sphingobacterium sp. Mn56C]|uniref:DUF4292 domain-containing protein n=1 Tax=Sphingobacterium sp. Mn56C TaxID=3395261 RepID=UPI003BED99F0